jgi:FAD/FMN-containing dehydrogenase
MPTERQVQEEKRQPRIDAATVRTFVQTIRGKVIEPGDELYETARRVYNGMIDKKPRLIVRCANVADVVSSVNFARDNGLELAIRGGSHNVAGLASVNDGLVIDLSTMKGIRIDPVRHTVRAEGGCLWGDLDHATNQFGLAVPGGIISTTGVAGLTLGGGIGHLVRKYGLSCDNLISADVVLADGRLVTASERENEDLFWALRGGGGNFGVVTSFEFKAHPVKTVLAGPVFYAIDKSADVLRFYREFIAGAPEELSAFFAFQIGPEAPFIPKHLQGVIMCAIVACYCGKIEKGEAVVKPIREFGPPALDLMGPLPMPALQSMFDALLPPGLQHYWKADYIHEITDEMIDIHVKYGPKTPTVQSTMHIYPTSGAVHKVRKDQTAYAARDMNFVHVIPAMFPDPRDTQKNMTWVRDYWNALHPHSAKSAYVNFLMGDEGEGRVEATYGSNYKRLAKIKTKYDPGNLFHVNQNIRPLE